MSDSIAVADLPGHDLGERTISLGSRDAALYAIAVGAKASELELVYERDLHALPTMAMAISLWAVEEAGVLGAYDPTNSLHIGEALEVSGELPLDGDVQMAGRVVSVTDKGKAALIDVAVTSDAFECTHRIFVPGAGGFENGSQAESAPKPAPAQPPLSGDPEFRSSVAFGESVAALYRLTGDRHPLHIDPEIASQAGFDRPILQGLCTLASTILEVSRGAGVEPWTLDGASARLSAPVLPGSVVDVAAWSDGDHAWRFTAEQAGQPVLKDARVSFASR